ncbi:MAG: CdaR family protein [Dehalococcoidia bacterium]
MQGIARVFQETLHFFMSLVRPTARSIGDNKGLAALSVVLAFGLWIFVTDSENPTRTRVLPVDIAVQPVNVPDDVAVSSDISPVRLRVTVADDVFGSLTASDFEATVNVDGLTVGSYDLDVEVRPLTGRGGLRIDTVLPETVKVDLAQLTSKSVPVVIDVVGQPAPGYTMSTAELDEETVDVTGPQEEVDKVTQATATIDVASRTESINQAVRLTPRDSRGFLVQRVTLDPPVTDVTIDIDQAKFARSVAVSVVTEGEPAPGYNVTSVSVSPATVTVRGDESFINGIFSINTKPVDLDGRDSQIKSTVSLDLPTGAEITGGVRVVTVTINIEARPGAFSYTVPLFANGLGGNLGIVGSLPEVEVQLVGPQPVLAEISAVDISATVNLTGLGPGTHTVLVEVGKLTGVTGQSSTPAEIQVTLE